MVFAKAKLKGLQGLQGLKNLKGLKSLRNIANFLGRSNKGIGIEVSSGKN